MPRKLLLSTTVCAGLFLSACVPAVETTEVQVVKGGVPNSTVQTVQGIVREMMKDPESAKFRETATYRTKLGDQIVCGEYDAKNSFGGYTGYDQYYFRLRNGAVMAKYVDTSSNEYNEYLKSAKEACMRAATGKLPIPSSQVK